MLCLKNAKNSALVAPDGILGDAKRVVWIRLEAGQDKGNIVGRIENGGPDDGKIVIHESDNSFSGGLGQMALATITLEAETFCYAKETEILRTFVGFDDRQIVIRKAVFSAKTVEEANAKLENLLTKVLSKTIFAPRLPTNRPHAQCGRVVASVFA